MWKCFKKITTFIPILLIKFYRKFISPFIPNRCRYVPSCSQYALTSLQRFGLLKGGWLAIKRICRCHPFSKHDFYDPVPDK